MIWSFNFNFIILFSKYNNIVKNRSISGKYIIIIQYFSWMCGEQVNAISNRIQQRVCVTKEQHQLLVRIDQN